MGVVQSYMGSELVAELRSWNQQEQNFSTLFSDQALQDRVFLKMKLNVYDQIWHKHRDGLQSTDEKALMVILQYHRSKLQKSLYPGLLTRLVVSTYNFLVAEIKKRMVRKAPDLYNPPAMVLPKDQVQTQDNQKSRQPYQRKAFNQQNNQQPRKNRNRNKGRSL